MVLSEILLIPSIYLAYHSVRLALTKNEVKSTSTYSGNIDVLVPAHNEENVIGDTVRSVQGENVNVLVIAHNCTDNTEQVAVDAGAQVIVSNEGATKGEALNAGYKYTTAPVIGVFDADSEIPENYYETVRGLLPEGAAVQTKVEIRNNGFLPMMAQVEFATYGQLIAGRKGLLAGNGQFIHREVLEEVGLWTSSLADDTEISLRIKQAGHDIIFTNKTHVAQEALTNFKQLINQRTRWSAGNMELIPKAIKAGDANLAIQTGALILIPVATVANIAFFCSINLATLPSFITVPLALSWPILMMITMIRARINPLKIIPFWAYLQYLNITVIKGLWKILKGDKSWNKTIHTGE